MKDQRVWAGHISDQFFFLVSPYPPSGGRRIRSGKILFRERRGST